MGCPCEEEKHAEPRKHVNTWGCGCQVMPPEPQRKGVVKFCDICDPCAPQKSNVKLCAFVVPTLEEGRYFRNSFIFVQEDDSTYYISDDRSEIPFGSRPKFINNFDPNNPGVAIRSTTVYDMENQKAYVFDADANYLVIQLGTKEINITGGAGILVTTYGGETFIGIDDEVVALKSDLEHVETSIDMEIDALADVVADKADRAHTLSGYGIDDAYTKTEVDEKIVGVYSFKGTVPTVADLPTDAEIGDVYEVTSEGINYAWDGTNWDPLGAVVDLSDYYNKQEINEKENIINAELIRLEDDKQDTLIAGEGIDITNNVISSTASGVLTADLTVSNPMGKYAQGDVIPEGTSFETILRGLLSKTYYPTFTAPSASLAYAVATLVKVGTVFNPQNATVIFNPGAINLQGAKVADRAGTPIDYSISTSGADSEFADTNETGLFNMPTLTKGSRGNITITAKVNFAEGPQPYDSDGQPYDNPLPASNVTTTKVIEFINPFYWGASSAAVVTDLAGLTEDLTKKGQKQYTYATNNQHMVIAYDASYGNLTSILDPNNFETINGWNKSTLAYNGQNYNVYITDLPTTDPSAKYTFKF